MISLDALLVLFTGALSYALDAVLVGFALALVRMRTGRGQAGYITIAALFLIFAFLGTYVLPAASVLGATVSIDNEPIARILEIPTEGAPLRTILRVEFLDSLFWAMQVVLALWVASQFSGPRTAAA